MPTSIYIRRHMSQMKSEFALALNQICAERGIDPKIVIESIKQAIMAALKRDLGYDEEMALEGYTVNVNEDTGAITVEKDGKDATYHKIGKGFWKDESEDNNYDGDFILLRELDAKEIVKMNDELTEYYKRKK